MINSKVMNVYTADKLVYMKFKALESIPFINHAVSTRHGGVSTADGLTSLNLGTQTADSMENVRENYRIFCNAAGFRADRVVLGKQTHSLNVRLATEADCGKGVFKDRDYDNVDSLITDVKNLPLVIHTADCVPVGFIDIKNQVIGIAHCGWRGTYGKLSSITIDSLRTNFGTDPRDIMCTIGPCICQSCYEVSPELYYDFEAKFGKSNSLLEKDDSYYIDLGGINRQILVEKGVPADNIIISDLCTCCSKNDLFSHRGQGPKRGILASVLEIV